MTTPQMDKQQTKTEYDPLAIKLLMDAFDRKIEEMERLEEQKENHGHD